MKKGFTLAELLGVIVILGIIAIITTTMVGRVLKTSHYKTCLAQEKNIIEGAKSWTYDNTKTLNKLDSGEIETIELSLSKLQNNEPPYNEIPYVEDGLKSPMTNEVYSSGTKVIISLSSSGSYNYDIEYGDPDKEMCTK